MMTLKNGKFKEIRWIWLSSIQQSYDMISEIDRFSFPVSEFLISHSFLIGNKRNKQDINEYLVKKVWFLIYLFSIIINIQNNLK